MGLCNGEVVHGIAGYNEHTPQRLVGTMRKNLTTTIRRVDQIEVKSDTSPRWYGKTQQNLVAVSQESEEEIQTIPILPADTLHQEIGGARTLNRLEQNCET